MISSLLSLIYANLRASWRKYILTGLGIAVAAFFLSAVLLLNTIISATYMAHYGNQVRNSDAVVATNISGQAKENSSGVLSVEEVEDIRNSPQVAGIREDSVVSAMYHDAPGDPVPYAISQAPTDPDLFPYQIQGRMPQNDHEILLPESLRESLHLNIGDKFHGIDPVATIKLPTPTSITNFEGGTLSLEDSLPTKEYTITGTFHSPPLGSEDSITVFAGGTMLTTTSKIAHREHKTNIVHDAHIVAVKLREGVSVEDFKREFTAHHDDHGYVVPAHEYAHKLEPDIGFANDLLTAALLGLAALALMVSAFVITNTFSVLLSQRTRELALLRTLGASRPNLLTIVLAESTVLGVLAASLGITLAYALWAVITSWAAHTLVFTFSLVPLGVTLPVCVAVTWIAALKPAYAASKVSPVQGLRDGVVQQVSTYGKRQGVIALLLLVASIVAYAVFMSKSSEHVPDGMEGTHSVQVLVVGIIAAALLGFAILSAAHKILSPLVKFWSSLIAHTLTGSIACKNALRSPARMVSTGRALLVGMMLIAMVLTGYVTLKASVTSFIQQTDHPAAVLTFNGSKDTEGNSSTARNSQNSESTAERYMHQAQDAQRRVQELPSVQSEAFVQYAGNLTCDDDSHTLTTSDGPVNEAGSNPSAAAGTLDHTDLPAAYAVSPQDIDVVLPGTSETILQGDVVVLPRSEQHALQGHKPPSFTLHGPRGDLRLTAVYSQTDDHTPYISRETAAKVQDLDHPQLLEGSSSTGESYVVVRAKQGLSSDESTELRNDLTDISRTTHGLYLAGILEMRAAVEISLIIIMYAILAIIALMVLISVLGVSNTLMLSAHERSRENALLRTLGLSRQQLRSVIMMEAILITLSALLVALIGGTLAGFILTRAITPQNIEIIYRIPLTEYCIAFFGALGIAVLASWVPSVRASKVSPVQALRED